MDDREPLEETEFQDYGVDSLDKTTFHSNLLRGAATEKFLSTEDLQSYQEDLQDARELESYRRKRKIFWLTVIVVVLTLIISTIVYFVCVHHKLIQDHDTACEGTSFTKYQYQCFTNPEVPAEAITFHDSAEACQQQCVEWSCYSLDFYNIDGECWLFTATSNEEKTQSEKDKFYEQMKNINEEERTKLLSCDHYKRNCD